MKEVPFRADNHPRLYKDAEIPETLKRDAANLSKEALGRFDREPLPPDLEIFAGLVSDRVLHQINEHQNRESYLRALERWQREDERAPVEDITDLELVPRAEAGKAFDRKKTTVAAARKGVEVGYNDLNQRPGLKKIMTPRSSDGPR